MYEFMTKLTCVGAETREPYICDVDAQFCFGSKVENWTPLAASRSSLMEMEVSTTQFHYCSPQATSGLAAQQKLWLQWKCSVALSGDVEVAGRRVGWLFGGDLTC